MFRDVLYKFYEDFYELTPTYLGRGVRFIYEYGSAVKEGSREALHNVYLETYIEVGFLVLDNMDVLRSELARSPREAIDMRYLRRLC